MGRNSTLRRRLRREHESCCGGKSLTRFMMSQFAIEFDACRVTQSKLSHPRLRLVPSQQTRNAAGASTLKRPLRGLHEIGWGGLEGSGGLESLGGDSSSLELEFERGIFSSWFRVSGSPIPTPTHNSSPCFIDIGNWYWQHWILATFSHWQHSHGPQISTNLQIRFVRIGEDLWIRFPCLTSSSHIKKNRHD